MALSQEEISKIRQEMGIPESGLESQQPQSSGMSANERIERRHKLVAEQRLIESAKKEKEKTPYVGQGQDNAGEIGVGILKGLTSTLTGASSLGERLLRGTAKTILPKSAERALGIEGDDFTPTAEKLIPEKARTPEGTGEKIGFYGEQIAEFLLPSAKVAKLEKGLSLLPRAATEAGIVGGQTAIQEGEINDKTKTAAIVSMLFPVAGTALSKAKGTLKPVGEKIQTSVIRPTSRDLKDGFNIANVKKYELGGTLEEIVTKTHVKLNSLSKKLSDKLKESDAQLDLSDVYNKTTQRLLKKKSSDFGNIKATQRVLKSLKEEIKEVSSDSVVDIAEATFIKRGAGTKGAWAFGRVEPDANAVETVYSTFYNEIKEAIEQVAPKEVGKINKQISELIPISNAALRRLPVEQRNNVIGLTDSIGLFASMFDPRALALLGANKLSKSGKFGEFLVNVATKTKERGSLGKRFFGN